MRLLLAEDEKELSRALTAILKHNHYSVDAVYDGADAYEDGLTANYDGIILDIMMPKKDGIAVVKELREKGIATPVLMLTARSEVDDRILGLDSGADDYLTKPFAMGELLARVRAMTRRRADFSPDARSRECHPVGKQGIPNSRNAFAPSRTAGFHRAVHGAHLGLRLRCGNQRGMGIHFFPSQKTVQHRSQRTDQGGTGRRVPVGGNQ